MPVTLLLVGCALAAGAAVIVFTWGLVLLRTEPSVPSYLGRPRRRQRKKLPEDDTGPLNALMQGIGKPFQGLLGTMLGPARLDRARRRIRAAGRGNSLDTETYLARRAGAVILLTLLAAGALYLEQYFVGILLLAFGQVWVDGHLWALARKRSTEIEKQLPDFLDVLAVTVSAGLGFRRALDRVVENTSGPLADEFNLALHQMDLGTPRRDAFRALRDRNDAGSLNQFITAVLQAEELGAPLTEALVEIATDMRQNTRQQARRRAARTAPRIQLVVVFFLVPGALLLFLGALILAVFSGDGANVFG